MAGLRRTQPPPGTTPVTAGYNPGIRPRPARPQPTAEPRLAPTPTSTQTLGLGPVPARVEPVDHADATAAADDDRAGLALERPQGAANLHHCLTSIAGR